MAEAATKLMVEVQLADSPQGVTMVAPLRAAGAGGSGSFLVRADDGNRYWCKGVYNLQHPRVPVNEQVVGRLGKVIEAATCDPQLVYVPSELAGWEFKPGHVLQEGWVHGSRAVDGAIETHALDHRANDENTTRHAGFFVVYDWLAGSDPQWLRSPQEQDAYYSHDHGH